MADFKPQEQLIERIHWLIRLRWIAVAGVILVILFVSQILKFPLPISPLYTIAIIIAIYNLIFFILLSSLEGKETFIIVNRVANAQISLDLLSLAGLIHFSGGIENPFIFYFIFHMIIASILLSRRASFLQATFAILLFCIMVISEYFGIFPHYCLKGFIINCQHNNLIYIVGVSFVFITTLYIAVYMASSISVRLRQRERILEEANALLREKDRIKSEYVLRVSHDIKEHLSAIQGCLEPVVAGITGELNPKQSDLLQRATERTVKLMFFVKALLEITRIKLSKELKMDYFSFKDMLSESINQIISRAKDKNISVSSTIEPTIDRIRGAKEYLQETIVNLLANSVKYTPHNGKIDINVMDKGNYIFIQIKDTGIGIPKDELPKIFDEFYRASNAREVERDGTGLGLSIAKQIVERHQGKIWVESEEGKGSIFSIELPK
ncbi:MAG: HAMP domain-containing histidine kinase [Candidatus Omnitrophica bacterium]|nr:HAMP domain-containing histidine kinase [Candidatus Omnitrophota bacterium]